MTDHADPERVNILGRDRVIAACEKRRRKNIKRRQNAQLSALGQIRANRKLGRMMLDHVPDIWEDVYAS